jgi:hypothetical protein
MGIDISNFYLGTPMDRYEYMKMPLALFPDHIVKQYNLGEKAKNGFVYLDLQKAIYIGSLVVIEHVMITWRMKHETLKGEAWLGMGVGVLMPR